MNSPCPCAGVFLFIGRDGAMVTVTDSSNTLKVIELVSSRSRVLKSLAIALVLSAGVSGKIEAQNASPSSFFPLHVGDYWEYDELRGFPTTLQKWVAKDTLIQRHPAEDAPALDSRRYFKVVTNDPVFGETFELLRVTDSLEVVSYKYEREVISFKLDAQVGVFWFSNDPDTTWKITFDVEYDAPIFGKTRRVKVFTFHLNPHPILEITYLLADSIGIVSYDGHGDSPSGYLRGALINGVKYGQISLSVPQVGQERGLPKSFWLGQNYPNPFNQSTVIPFLLKKPSFVTLKIYNKLGGLVKILLSQWEEAGFHNALWDGKDHTGKSVSTGLYFFLLQVGKNSSSRAMLLIR